MSSDTIEAKGNVEGAPVKEISQQDASLAEEAPVSQKKQSLSDLFTIFAAGAGLVSDGYSNNLMTMINVLLAASYPAQYTSSVSTRVSNALLVGEIIGQIFIGLTCDLMGRKAAIVLTTVMIVLGGIIAAASNGVTIEGMFWMMTVGRGLLGVGTGGEYPAASVSASESANEYTPKHRGPLFILCTNLPLSIGGPFAVSVFLIVWKACGQAHYSTVWRVCFAIGCIWPLFVFVFRMRMLNSQLYRRGAIKKQVPYLLVLKYYWKNLIGTCGAWFLYDMITFSNGVFSGTILSSIIGKSDSEGAHITKTAEYQLLLGAIALPGVLIGAAMCNRVGRKNTMMIGFGGYLVFGLIVGCSFHQLSKIVALFVLFYGLMNSSGNLGPGNMLGLLSSETYATPVRGTCYGLSAAVGKAGAAVGVQVFLPIQKNLGKQWTFIFSAIIGVVGILVTWLFVEDVSGDDLAIRDEAFRGYLVKNGWNGVMGEADLKGVAADGVQVSDSEQAVEEKN